MSSIANAPKGGIGEVKNCKDAVTVREVARGLAQDDEDWDADCWQGIAEGREEEISQAEKSKIYCKFQLIQNDLNLPTLLLSK